VSEPILKLGETVERQRGGKPRRFVFLQRFWQHELEIDIRILTPIPDGMEASDVSDLRGFPGAIVEGSSIPLILRELARLRSDEWLEKAAEEIAEEVGRTSVSNTYRAGHSFIEILRKHRDSR
jgi:hypothetical protein